MMLKESWSLARDMVEVNPLQSTLVVVMRAIGKTISAMDMVDILQVAMCTKVMSVLAVVMVSANIALFMF